MRFPAPIGELDEAIVLVYCDGPVLFIGSDAVGGSHLVVLAVERRSGQEWLAARLSPERRRRILENRIDLHDAFRHAEGGVVARLRVPRDLPSEDGELTWVSCDTLTGEMLPEPECFADYEPDQTEQLALPDPKATARATGLDVLIIHLFPDTETRHEVPLSTLGRAATATQELLSAIANHGISQPGTTGTTRSTAVRRAVFNAVATHAASFALELHAADVQRNLWSQTETNPVLKQFFELLSTLGSDANLRETLSRYVGSKAPAKLRDLLSAVVESVPRVEFLWGSPAESSQTARVGFDLATARSAKFAIAQVTPADDTEFPVVGRMVAADTRVRTFKLVEDEDGSVFAGKVADEVVLEGIVIQNAVYLARIRKTVMTDASGDTITRFQLVHLECLGSEPEESPTTL